MVTSPSTSPPHKWSSSLQGGGNSGNGQLLQELEALSQALYQAQRNRNPSQDLYSQAPPQPSPQPPAAPSKKPSFIPRKETLTGRRLSSYESSKNVSPKEPIPFSALSPHDPPPSFTNLLSRHSMSAAQAPASFEQQHPGAANSHPRFSSSVASSSYSPTWGKEKSDIRSRMDRRLSLQPWQAQNSDKSVPPEPEWPEDPLESSRRFDSSSSDKKKSVWNWKPLRALSHIGRQRLHCVFSAYVHAIEGLPPAMYGLRLCVHMRKEETREGAVQTMPSRVFQGIAEFQETLFMKCTLYANKGPSSMMKYMERTFIVSVIAPDIDELDFGRHQLDLSRMIGEYVDDRRAQLERGSSWDTTLDLTGKAKGGKLVITFNYEVLDKDSASSGNVSSRFRNSLPHRSSMHTSYSLPSSAHGTPRTITTRAHLSHSPGVSELGNDYDDLLAMDQLNLDELPVTSDQKIGQAVEVQGFPAIRSQPADRPSQDALNTSISLESPIVRGFSQAVDQDSSLSRPSMSADMAPQNVDGDNSPIDEENEHSSEDETEFLVVDQGMEIGKSLEHSSSDVTEVKEVYSEVETPDVRTSQLIEMEAMDDIPSAMEMKLLDSPSQLVVEMEALDDPTQDVVEIEDLDDLNPHAVEESSEEISLHEAHENLDKLSQAASSPEQVEGTKEDKEVHADDNERIAVIDQGEKKDNVTYMMVMQTLDSLLEGTSAKVLPQEEENLESSADELFSDEEDMADKEATSVSVLSHHEEEDTSSVADDDFHGVVKEEEDEEVDTEEEENKEEGADDEEDDTVIKVVKEEEYGVNNEEESIWSVERQEIGGKDVKRGGGIFLVEEATSYDRVEEEPRAMSDIKEEERAMSSGEDEERSWVDVVREDRGISNTEGWEGNVVEKGRDLVNVKEDEGGHGDSEEEVEEERGNIPEGGEQLDNQQEASFARMAVEREVGVDADENLDNEVDLVADEFFEMLGMGDTVVDKSNDSPLIDSPRAPSSISSYAFMVESYDSPTRNSPRAPLDNNYGSRLDSPPRAPMAKSTHTELESPRARLLRQFEEEALLEGSFGLDFDMQDFGQSTKKEEDSGALSVSEETYKDLLPSSASESINTKSGIWDHSLATDKMEKEPAKWDMEDDEDLISIMEAAESELERATQSMRSKTRAKMLEDEETEALMQEWGLNEKAFATSPPKPPMRQPEPPPLGKGLGPTLPLKDGGSLRVMNPSHFQANKSNGKLVMQISKPVVVPAEMGSETADILRNMASMGIENMALQAMAAMPLEDITGCSAEQVAVEGMTAAEAGNRLLDGHLGSRKELSWKSQYASQKAIEDCLTLEDLAPTAMQQIEALALDGLKIQADVDADETPYNLNTYSPGESIGNDVLGGSTVLKGVTGMHLPKGAKSAETGDGSGKGLMGMAISLDEWMLLDAGLYDEVQTNKDTMALMAAHHAAHQDIVLTGGGDEEKRKKRPGSKIGGGARWGCMGNTLTIAMLVQLRDPLKNNEAVGAPMMAFVQAERLMKPPKMKVGRNVSIKGNSEVEEGESSAVEEETEFKITGVHMAGMKAATGEEKKGGWGSQKQLQSGSRWLLANGMSKKSSTHPLLGAVKQPLSSKGTSNAGRGTESLWSISSKATTSTGSWWKDKLRMGSRR